jgi:hypothetical protein
VLAPDHYNPLRAERVAAMRRRVRGFFPQLDATQECY